MEKSKAFEYNREYVFLSCSSAGNRDRTWGLSSQNIKNKIKIESIRNIPVGRMFKNFDMVSG